jgi:hypothetical protein
VEDINGQIGEELKQPALGFNLKRRVSPSKASLLGECSEKAREFPGGRVKYGRRRARIEDIIMGGLFSRNPCVRELKEG